MSRRFDVVIAGGGMVGAALALALNLGGKRVAVIEPKAVARPQPDDDYRLRVSALSLASQAMLDNLGAWQQLTEWRVSPYEHMLVWDAGGSGKIEFHATETDEPWLGHIVENDLIQAALYQQCRQHSDIEWLAGRSLSGFTVDQQEVIITLDNQEVLLASLIVGADGAHSRVRELAEIPLQTRDYAQQAIVANVNTAWPHDNTARQRFLPDGILAFLPLADGHCSIVWSRETTESERLMTLSDADFSAELGEAFEFVLGDITSISQRAAFPLHGRHAETYVKPRIALVGDAAHTIHPLAGQGVNLGFMDVAVLSELLTGSEREPGSLHLLRKYERARHGENELMLRAMEGFKLLFNNTNPVLSVLRNTGLSVASQVKPLKQFFMQQAMGQSDNQPALTQRPISHT